MSKQNDSTICSTTELTSSCKIVATSTPIKDVPPMEIDIESTKESSNESSDEDSELTQSSSRRVPNVGKDWDCFKPMRTSSLYYVVLNTSDSLNDMAHRWFNFWESDPKEAMINILQFFLDVAGYQNYQISRVYGTKKFNEKTLLEEFKNNYSVVLENYTYLLRTNSAWSTSFKAAIYEFLQDIVLMADKRSSYNYSMLEDMFQFIKFMAHSEMRPLKHTAVVLAMKFLLVLSKLYREYKNKITPSFNNGSTVALDVDILRYYRNRASTLMKFMKDLFHYVNENCWYHDPEMEEMRQECLKGLYKMLNYTFEFYTKMLEIIKQCLNNPSKKTRLATIEMIIRIVKNLNFYQHLKGKSADIFRTVIYHRLDVDYNVAIETINIFIASVKLYKREIPFDILNSIYKMVYNRFYPLGSAAGKFLYAMISDSLEEEAGRIKMILKFSRLPEMQHLSPLLVESLIDWAPELRSYDVILDSLLLGEELLAQDKIKLLEILCHTVVQTVKGKSTILRENYREGVIDYKQIEIAFKKVVSKFETLFSKFANEKVCVKNLLQMLLAFSYNDKFTSEHKSAIQNVLKFLSNYFLETKDSEILDMISELFSKISPIHGANMLEDIHKRYIDRTIADNKDSWNMDDIEATLLQMQSLFKYQKILLNWNINVVREVFPEITPLNETLLSYNVSCSCEYEKSVFRNTLANILSNEDQARENLENLRTECDKFLAECYGYLHDGSSKVITEKVFESLCDFYNEIAHQMYKNEAEHPHVMILKNSLDPEHKYLLLKFLDEHVFNTAVSESIGLKHFMKFSQCIMKRGLPLCLLPNVFVYYNKFYTKYGALFDQILKNLSLINANTVGVIVSATIFSEFQNVRNKEDTSDDNHQYIEIKKLALLFVKSISLQERSATLRFAVTMAFIKEDNLVFLMCLEVFCNEMPPNSKKFILDVLMKQQNYNKVQRDKHVVQFIECLTNVKRKRVQKDQVGSKRHKRAQSASTSSYATSYTDVTDEDETDATLEQETGDSD